jgi:hypothetical protein
MLEIKYKYSMILRMFLISYLSFYLTAILNITAFSVKNLDDITGSIAGLFGSVVFIIFPIHVFNYLTANVKNLNNPDF